MPNKFISIQESADLSNKSVQTIRRAIKSKKLKHRKQKTPQGFNYMVNYEALCTLYGIKSIPDVKVESKKEKIKLIKPKKSEEGEGMYVTNDNFRALTVSLEKMISQHSEERQNFIRLVDTLQEKIFVLENQLNLLQTPAKKWYQVWR